jgi:hypothetical protein
MDRFTLTLAPEHERSFWRAWRSTLVRADTSAAVVSCMVLAASCLFNIFNVAAYHKSMRAITYGFLALRAAQLLMLVCFEPFYSAKVPAFRPPPLLGASFAWPLHAAQRGA